MASTLAAELEDRTERRDAEPVSALVERLATLAPALVRQVSGVSLDALRAASS